MEYIYSALLLHSAKKELSEENIKNVIKAAGLEPDPARVKALASSLSSINIDEAIASSAVVAPAAAAQPQQEKKEEKKEEKKKEEAVSEEEAAAGLGALFG